ncbi:phage/plasmid primase, P4 family [Dehalococcoidia bacterium]|nr:phage/plasmid primase, P4 family [Dehalococcoidia bacterium]
MSESSHDGLMIELPVGVDLSVLEEREITRLVRDYLFQSGKMERKSYLNVNAKGKGTLDLESLTCDLLREFHFKTFRDNEEILVYQDGVWRTGGEVFIKAECERRVGIKEALTTHDLNEITAHIQRSTYTDRGSFNADKFILNVKNGLLDVRTRELKPHTPDHLSTVRIPVNYDPDAVCPIISKFLSEILHPQDVSIIEELLGYVLIPDYSIQRGFLLIGDGANGKTTLLNLIKNFVGKENCCSISWHALETNRFATSDLEGKLVNIYADLPSQSLRYVGQFKMLTGGDVIGGERKFKSRFHFVNFARLLFSANRPPRVENEDSFAFWRRWVILDFPNQFTDTIGNRDKDILEKLTTEEEMSGLLNLALDGLGRLLDQGDFSFALSAEDVASKYMKAADPVYAFVEECCSLNGRGWIAKRDLYDAYISYCTKNGIPKLGMESFGRQLKNTPNARVTSKKKGGRGERVWAWEGISLLPKESEPPDDF